VAPGTTRPRGEDLRGAAGKGMGEGKGFRLLNAGKETAEACPSRAGEEKKRGSEVASARGKRKPAGFS